MAEALTVWQFVNIGMIGLGGFALGVLFAIADCNRRGH